jgi:hypothetical protein
MKITNLGLACVLGLLAVGPTFAATRYVNVWNATPAAPYTTWESASTSIQLAIDEAVSGDEILVAPGVYLIPETVQIPAGKTLTLRSAVSREAVIDGGGFRRGLAISGENSWIEGFTIQNGFTVGAGGGIVMYAASTVRDCRLVGNQAETAGGILLRASPARVEDCTIESNLANSAWGGAGIYEETAGTLNRCIIRGNVASNYGGGVGLQAAGTISNCWIADNRAVLMEGGGVSIDTAGKIVNSVLVGNQAAGAGGGIFSSGGGYVAHCTVVSNTSASFGGGIRSTAITSWNNVVYYNLAPVGGNVSDSFSVFENNCTTPSPGGSNFADAPAFVDLAGRDFHLAEGSPCIDAGAANPGVADDYDGTVRPRSGAPGAPPRYDVGAFEFVRPGGAAAGDFDGDGTADGAVFRPADGNWIFQYSAGGSATQAFGSRTMVPVPADYDGDGRTDVALYRPASGEWFILNSGGGSRRVTFGPNSTMIPLPGDYDGDGRADLALFYPASARWYFFGSTEGYSSVQFGGRADVPVPADYDGDGATDIAVYRPSSGTWYVIYSGGGSRVTQLGWAGTVPVPADYDGDGRADLAVLSRATSTWCINYSAGGSLILPFGYKTMTPVPADYDGDGAADVAMYHSPSGRWYLRQSSNGAHRQETLGGPGHIPVLLIPLIHSWFGLS